jgi:hypothetical protein
VPNLSKQGKVLIHLNPIANSDDLLRFRWAACQMHELQRVKASATAIKHALKNLPRDLDETYVRIFSRVPSEGQTFVRDIMQWIYFHDQFHRTAIPLSILLSAIERKTSQLHELEGYSLDEDLFHEFCGCLVAVTVQDHIILGGSDRVPCVSFAHYTVLEFLVSARILDSQASFFALGDADISLKLTSIIFSEVLDMRQTYIWKRFNLPLFDNLTCYSVVTSILLIRYRGIQDLDDATFDQALDLFDASSPHFDHFRDTTANFEKAGAAYHFGSEISNPLLTSFFWHDKWFGPHNSRSTAVLRLLRMFPGEPGQESVTTIFNKYADDLMTAYVALETRHATPWDNNVRKRYTLKGTMVEIIFQIGYRFNLEVVTRNNLQTVDLTTLLLICIGLSRVGEEETTMNSVTQLLELGADPNGLGYAITPLQIATDIRSVSIVRRLLEAGASPNNDGNPNGTVLEETTPLGERYNRLAGASPLQICREFKYIPRSHDIIQGTDYRQEERKEIEGLLLEYDTVVLEVQEEMSKISIISAESAEPLTHELPKSVDGRR